jgi:hypothetical protein
MAPDCCDLARSSVSCRCRRRIVRQKDQKAFRAYPNAESDPEASEDFHKEGVAYAIAYCFCQTKESFANSIPDTKKQIDAQENVSYSNAERIPVGNRDSVWQSDGNTGTGAGKERMAERLTLA